MSQVSAIVSEIYQGIVQSGRSKGKSFWSITLSNGTKLTAFEELYVQDLAPGREYTFTIEKKGAYLNLTGEPVPVVQLDTPQIATAPVALPEEKVQTYTTQESERTYKNRISALQAAVNYVGNCMGGTAAEKEVLETAKEFEEYIKTGG